MYYKNYLLLFLCFLVSHCASLENTYKASNIIYENNFTNKGFTLVYDIKLYEKKIISSKLDERDLVIFQRNLKKNSLVKITNILNDKYLLVKVGDDSLYPAFNNSVISKRIMNELDLNVDEPYVEIKSISENSLFVAKKAKTFDEERKVANKVPVKNISIDNLNIDKNIISNKPKKKFSYIIKIADFYFNETALTMSERIKVETKIKKANIKKITDRKYRVFLGPFSNINSLQKSFNDIQILEFENIEIIQND